MFLYLETYCFPNVKQEANNFSNTNTVFRYVLSDESIVISYMFNSPSICIMLLLCKKYFPPFSISLIKYFWTIVIFSNEPLSLECEICFVQVILNIILYQTCLRMVFEFCLIMSDVDWMISNWLCLCLKHFI